MQVDTQTLDLTFGVHTLTLTNPNWADVTRVVFQRLTATGAPGAVAVDNITASAIPEPAAVTLPSLDSLASLPDIAAVVGNAHDQAHVH